MLTAWLRDMRLIVALGQLLCSSNGASRKTGGMEERKKMNIKQRACCWPCKSSSHWCGLTCRLPCIHAYVGLWIHSFKEDTNHVHNSTSSAEIHTLEHKYYTVIYVWVPAVCVAVAVNMALAGAARSWTLQHILMHGQNWGDNNTVRENPILWTPSSFSLTMAT